jgi:hypothetical protein
MEVWLYCGNELENYTIKIYSLLVIKKIYNFFLLQNQFSESSSSLHTWRIPGSGVGTL